MIPVYSAQEETRLSGPRNGLELVLDLETDYYLGRGITSEEGAKVIVHSPNLTPLIGVSGGFNIRANEQVRRRCLVRCDLTYYWCCDIILIRVKLVLQYCLEVKIPLIHFSADTVKQCKSLALGCNLVCHHPDPNLHSCPILKSLP